MLGCCVRDSCNTRWDNKAHQGKENSAKVQKLLEKYSYITCGEMPNGLQPKRKFAHVTNWNPGVTSLNQAMHRMSLLESIELNWQDGNLLSKGFIRESMNPCMVSTLISLKKDGHWRMYTDYRSLNKITNRYRFPLSRMDDLMDSLRDTR
jgi:hypothetical protein